MKEWIKRISLTGLIVGSIFGLGYGCSQPKEFRGRDMLYKRDMNGDGVLDVIVLSPENPLHKRCLVWYDGRQVEEKREDGMKVYTAYGKGNYDYNPKNWVSCADWCLD